MHVLSTLLASSFQVSVPAFSPADLEHVEYVQGRHDAVAVAGRTYVAEMRDGEFHFAPRVSTGVDRDPRLTLRLESVERSGEAMALIAGASAVRDGEALVADRGAVLERYEVDLESVEQTFRFDEPTAGPLAVTVAFDTELDVVERDGGALFLDGGGREGIAMSSAFAYDASGRSIPLDTRFDEGRYRIEVPASFTASAIFPVTIDPIFSTITVDDWSLHLFEPRVVFDEASGWYVAIYEEYDPGHSAIYLRIFTEAGVPTHSYYAWFSATERYSSPGLASGGANGKVLVAAVRDAGPGTPGEIVSKLIDVPSGAPGPEVRLDSGHHVGPFLSLDAGGSQFGWFHVAWEFEKTPIDHDILSRLVAPDGTVPPGQNILIAVGAENTKDPQVPKDHGTWDGTHSTWPVVYSIEGDSAEFDRVGCTELNGSGSIRHTTHTSPGPGAEPRISSPLEGAGPRKYLVAYHDTLNVSRRIWTAQLQDGAISLDRPFSGGDIPGWGSNDEEFAYAVECNGSRCCMVWLDSGPAAPRTFFSTLNLTPFGFVNSEDYPLIAPHVTFVTDLAVAGTGAGTDYVAVYEYEPPGETTHVGAVFYDDAGDRVGDHYCQAQFLNSTGYPAMMHIHGSPVVGEPMTLVAEDLPPNSFGFFLVATAASSGSVPPGSQGRICLGGSIGRYQAQAQNSGPAGWFSLEIDTANLPLNPFQPAIAGNTYYFQGWYRDANPTPTSNFTIGTYYTAE